MKQSWLDYIRNMENSKQTHVPEYIWENVKQHIPQPKKSRRIIPFFWVLLSLGFLGAIGIFFFANQNTNSTRNSQSELFNNNGLLSKEMNKDNNSETVGLNSEKKVTEIQNTNEVNRTSKAGKSKNFVNNNFKSNTLSDGQFRTKENKLEPIEVSQSSDLMQDESSIQAIEEVQSERGEINLHTIEPKIPGLIVKNEERNIPLAFNSNLSDCYDFRNRVNPIYYVEAYVGPQYSPFSLQSRSIDYDSFLKRRKTSESSHISGVAGIRIGIDIKNINIKVGLEYQKIYEQLNFSNGNDTQIVNVINNGQLFRTDTITGKRIIQIHNAHNLLSLPVSVGYRIDIGRQGLVINGGVAFSLNAKHTGALLDSISRPSYFNTSSNSQFKTNVGMSPFVSLQWIGNLMGNINYFIEPTFQVYLSPFNHKINPIDQKYQNFNLKLGLQYSF